MLFRCSFGLLKAQMKEYCDMSVVIFWYRSTNDTTAQHANENMQKNSIDETFGEHKRTYCQDNRFVFTRTVLPLICPETLNLKHENTLQWKP